MRYSDAWSDACVQCRATPAEHWDELAARQLDPAGIDWVRPVYATLCSHPPVELVRRMRRSPLARGGWLPALDGPADGESVDGRVLWPSWWVNTSGNATGTVLFDRWVGKAVLGREFRRWDQLTELADAGRRDLAMAFTACYDGPSTAELHDAGRPVLRAVVRFWRRFAWRPIGG